MPKIKKPVSAKTKRSKAPHKVRKGKYPARLPGKTHVSLSLDEADLEMIDQRADELGLNRSNYLVLLAKQDIRRKSDFLIPSPTKKAKK